MYTIEACVALLRVYTLEAYDVPGVVYKWLELHLDVSGQQKSVLLLLRLRDLS
jgi:hypothetical protein